MLFIKTKTLLGNRSDLVKLSEETRKDLKLMAFHNSSYLTWEGNFVLSSALIISERN